MSKFNTREQFTFGVFLYQIITMLLFFAVLCVIDYILICASFKYGYTFILFLPLILVASIMILFLPYTLVTRVIEYCRRKNTVKHTGVIVSIERRGKRYRLVVNTDINTVCYTLWTFGTGSKVFKALEGQTVTVFINEAKPECYWISMEDINEIYSSSFNSSSISTDVTEKVQDIRRDLQANVLDNIDNKFVQNTSDIIFDNLENKARNIELKTVMVDEEKHEPSWSKLSFDDEHKIKKLCISRLRHQFDKTTIVITIVAFFTLLGVVVFRHNDISSEVFGGTIFFALLMIIVSITQIKAYYKDKSLIDSIDNLKLEGCMYIQSKFQCKRITGGTFTITHKTMNSGTTRYCGDKLNMEYSFDDIDWVQDYCKNKHIKLNDRIELLGVEYGVEGCIGYSFGEIVTIILKDGTLYIAPDLSDYMYID